MKTKMKVYLAIISCSFMLAGAQNNGDVRVVGGTSGISGRVEVFVNNQWGTIGYNSTTSHDVAISVCLQLGYHQVREANYATVMNFPIAGSGVNMPFVNISCPFSPPHILRCNYVYDPNAAINHNNDMGVACKPSSTYIPYDTEVRLNQGNTGFKSSGFVQLYIYGQWGSVCGMGSSDADSACRQLGYTRSNDFGSARLNNVSPNVKDFFCSHSHSCLRSCFSYPSYDEYIYCSDYSYINCTYNRNDAIIYSYGSEALCTYSATIIVGVVVGVIFALLFTIILCIAIPVVICFCVPGCILFGTRRRTLYRSI